MVNFRECFKGDRQYNGERKKDRQYNGERKDRQVDYCLSLWSWYCLSFDLQLCLVDYCLSLCRLVIVLSVLWFPAVFGRLLFVPLSFHLVMVLFVLLWFTAVFGRLLFVPLVMVLFVLWFTAVFGWLLFVPLSFGHCIVCPLISSCVW
jgi:hypothetical protein